MTKTNHLVLRYFDHHAIYIGTGQEVLEGKYDLKDRQFNNSLATDFLKNHPQEQLIIEFNGRTVALGLLTRFVNNHGVPSILQYTQNGEIFIPNSRVVLTRAFQRLGQRQEGQGQEGQGQEGQGKIQRLQNLATKNCEHFASYCMTGDPISYQIDIYATAGLVGGVSIIALVIFLAK